MEIPAIFGLILCVLTFIILVFTCMGCNSPENEQTTEELPVEIANVAPSAPVIEDTVTFGQDRFVNDALRVEENEQAHKDNIELPLAYEDLFVETK